VKVDIDRIEKYLGEIAAEAEDISQILQNSDKDILKSKHLLKSLKYSTIVIAEAIASTLQHLLAKKHNVVVGGYLDVFDKSITHSLLNEELFGRLQPFIKFRNMLVHQYWRVKDEVFLQNMRKGRKDFSIFAGSVKKQLQHGKKE